MNIEMREGTLSIELTDDLVASVVRNNLERAKESIEAKEPFNKVSLDISGIENIDSIGITFIVGLYKAAIENDREFKVVGASKEIVNLFDLMSLDEVFPIE